MTLRLNSTFLVKERTFTVAAIFPFLKKIIVIEDDIKQGAVLEFDYEFADPYAFGGEISIPDTLELRPTVWPASAIQNRPGYSIDNFCLGKSGRVRAADIGNAQVMLNVTIAKSGVVFAK